MNGRAVLKRLAKYLLAISLAGNQLGNALTGGAPDETISYRAARAREHGSKGGRAVCRVLNAFDFHHQRAGEDHCDKAARHHAERLERAATTSSMKGQQTP